MMDVWFSQFQFTESKTGNLDIMKLTLFATAFAALASTGFAESSIRVNDANAATTIGAAATTTGGDAPAAAVDGGVAPMDKPAQRGLGKKADGKNPDGYMCKLCCNDDDHC